MRDDVDFVKKDDSDEKEKGEARVWEEQKKVKNEKEDKISSLWKSFKKWQKTVLLSEQQTNTTEEERTTSFHNNNNKCV